MEEEREGESVYNIDVDALEKTLRDRGILQQLNQTFNLIAVPLLIISVICVGFILVWAREILVPFVIALFFTYLLKPFVRFLRQPWGTCGKDNFLLFFSSVICRRRDIPRRIKEPNSAVIEEQEFLFDESSEGIELSNFNRENVVAASRSGRDVTARWQCRNAKCPRWIAILICMIFVFGFFTGVVVLIADAIQTFEEEDIEVFEEKSVTLLVTLREWMKRNFGMDGISTTQQLSKEFHWVSITKTLVLGIVQALEYVFIIFLFVLYMLFEDSDIKKEEDSFNNSYATAVDLRRLVDQQIQRYIVIKTLISLAVGVAVYIVLGPMLEIKMAHVFAVITFFANFIPNFGAMLATAVPIPMVILDENQTTVSRILAIALPVLIHSIVGNVIEPKVFGDTMELHPVVVLISLSFWYMVWGIPGAILSVPITAVMRIILLHIKHPYAQVILLLLEGKMPGSRAFHVHG